MEKQILMEYIDACELIRETEQDIQRLKRKKSETVQGSVKGSNPDFPYQEQHFRLERLILPHQDAHTAVDIGERCAQIV